MILKKFLSFIGTIIVFIILFIFFVFPIQLDLLNSDLGRHLLLGKIIFTSGNVPIINLLSYTYPDYPFINTHWFSQVIFYLWHNAFGFNGLIILSLILGTVTFAVLFIYSAKKYNLFATILISLIYLQAISARTQVRPELFSFLFLAIFIVILYIYKEKYTKWIFALIPLSLIWVNTHIYFFNGIVVLLFSLIDAYLSKEKYASKKFRTLLFVTVSASLVTLCNPHFIEGALYPLFVLNEYGVNIRENMNFFMAAVDYTKPTTIFFEISVLLLWITLFISRKKLSALDFFLSIFFTFVGFFAIRNFPLFVFGTFIPCIKATSYILHTISNKYKNKATLIKSLLFIVIFLSILPSIKLKVDNHGIGFGVVDQLKDAIKFFNENNLKGPIYNNYDIGNYLEYKLYPQEKVYVDNRPEAYPKAFFQEVYFPMQRTPELFNNQSNKYNFNILFIAHTETSQSMEQFLGRIIKDKSWKMIYLNSIAVIFIKDIPANKSIIDKYTINQKNVKMKKSDLKDKQKVIQLINFFGNIGWADQQLKMIIKYLTYDPQNCSALKGAAKLLQQKQDSSANIYIYRYQNYGCKS